MVRWGPKELVHARHLILQGRLHNKCAPGSQRKRIDLVRKGQKIVGLQLEMLNTSEIGNLRK